MIRHVVLVRFEDGADRARVAEFVAAMGRVHVEGLRSLTLGLDLGLRPGNWDYALVADLDDEAAYRRYDDAPEHRRIRDELGPGLFAAAARVQYEIPG